jgi:hypothetical protein
MYAVAAEQKAVVQRHWMCGIVETDFGLHPKRAGENVGSAAGVHAHVIGG